MLPKKRAIEKKSSYNRSNENGPTNNNVNRGTRRSSIQIFDGFDEEIAVNESFGMLEEALRSKVEENDKRTATKIKQITINFGVDLGHTDPTHKCDVTCTTDNIRVVDPETNTYGCIKSGETHCCHADSRCEQIITNKDGDTICLFSGIVLDRVIQQHIFEKCVMGAEEVTQREDVTSTPKLSASSSSSSSSKSKEMNFISDAKKIVYQLIWNADKRSTLGKTRLEQLRKATIRDLQKYKKDCDRGKKIPCDITIIAISTKHRSKKRLIPVISMNPTMNQYLCNIIMNVWRLITNTPLYKENSKNFPFRLHVIGMLYLMQKDYVFEDTLILPKIDFLSWALPAMEDIPLFSDSKNALLRFNKSDITNGITQLKRAFNSVPEIMKKNDIFTWEGM